VSDELVRLADIEAVRLLMARYHQACDGWDADGTHRDPDAIADLFADDGVWDVTPQQAAAVGREQIAERARELQAIAWIVHFVVNPIVEVDGDTARGDFKGIVRIRMTETSRPFWLLGIYRALAARTRAGWRLSSLSFERLSVTREAPSAGHDR
jgi:hypothetical protein